MAYSKPNTSCVNAFLQKDNAVHIVDDFTENGFVFSPFDSDEDTIIFPLNLCEMLTSEMSKDSILRGGKDVNTNTDAFRKSHLELVQKGIIEIENSSLEKVVLSRVESVATSEKNPISLFKGLMNAYPSAFTYIWYHPVIGLWLGATPETLLDVEGQRFKTMALAGTQAHTELAEVKWDTKNVEEQNVVTNFIERTLSIHTQQLTVMPAQTVKAGKLLHLQSKISGVLKTGRLQDIIFALHPTPAVCGLPKQEAKTFILNNEDYNREFYTGFLGELNFKRSKTRNANRRNIENNAYTTVKTTSQLFVNLRCMQIKNQNALIYVGGGITKDSNPEQEWEETINKSQTIKSVLM
ncbi:chorismate-binding protein [Psychroserpens sp. MEBiC05023]